MQPVAAVVLQWGLPESSPHPVQGRTLSCPIRRARGRLGAAGSARGSCSSCEPVQQCLLCWEGEQTEKPSCGLKTRVSMCSWCVSWVWFFSSLPPWRAVRGFWGDPTLGGHRSVVDPNHGGHGHWCLLGFCSMVSWAVPSSSSAPILAWLEATRNASDFVSHLQFWALFPSGCAAALGRDRAGWHRALCCWPCHWH